MTFSRPYLGQKATAKKGSTKGNWASFNIKLKTNTKGMNAGTSSLFKASNDMGEVVGSILTRHYLEFLSPIDT